MSKKPWHEDDRLWETISPAIFTSSQYKDAPEQVASIIDWTGITPGMRVLDLCCGVGRHSLEFARRGYRVTAVDRTAEYLDEARKRAADAELEIEFIEEDMRNFLRQEDFDIVVNLFTSFGYFEDREDDRKVVGNVYKSLKPGGYFILDMMGKEVLARIFQEHHWSEEDGLIVLQEGKLSRNWGWIESRWILLDDDGRREIVVTHRLFSAVELSDLLTGCGFEVDSVYGSFQGVPYDHRADRLIVIAKKPS